MAVRLAISFGGRCGLPPGKAPSNCGPIILAYLSGSVDRSVLMPCIFICFYLRGSCISLSLSCVFLSSMYCATGAGTISFQVSSSSRIFSRISVALTSRLIFKSMISMSGACFSKSSLTMWDPV